ncbi:MAG: ribosomal RNA small subunit methyltransferase A [Elusimicrobia bacterium RIFCSPLOWO2_01_FULL_59_12]|nr:MAG: ribosomal RNA small subunit methyltransferase A [Elusimicrobia bacterium RIFCSPLOWO2_01_FULL_59_12]
MRPPLGQHFLRDPRVIQTILAAAEIQPADTALEIGPGKGVLTEPLASRVKELVAVEFDRTLAPKLQARFAAFPHVRIVQADFLKINLDELFKSPIKVLGNLPYSITSPIFEKLLAWPGWDTGVFLIQREVADRMRSGPGSKTFGVLSLAVQLFAEVDLIAPVKPGAFAPPPRVHSAVIRLRRKPARPLPDREIPAFFDLAHAAFSHRRKTLANSLSLFAETPKKNVAAWLDRCGVRAGARAESLGLPDYVRLANPWSIFRREINLT